MNYLFLAFEDGGQGNALSPAERTTLREACRASNQALRESGHLLVAGQLQGNDAVMVRLQDGEVSLAEGPAAHRGGCLTGLFLIHARDLNDAIHVAATMPQARSGPIEVMPLAELNE